MRSRLAIAFPLLGACALAAVSAVAVLPSGKQPNGTTPDASARATSATTDAGSPATADGAATASTTASLDAAVSTGGPNTFNLALVQRGTGALVHYPVPEQLQRTEVPVFAQVRTTAPIDHLSLFYRGHGGTRYREARMTPVGATFGLPNGWGAQIPCDDAFPPAVEYYVQAIDTSGAAVGEAGSATEPISLPIVLARTNAIIPTLPGEAPPRNCGTIASASFVPARDAGRSGDGGSSEEDPLTGTADLGEPCHKNDECRRGLRCGTNHACVFNR